VRVLVVNAGSSSLKVDLVDGGAVLRSYDGLPKAAPQLDAVGTGAFPAARTSSNL
jgi:acetate kinase